MIAKEQVRACARLVVERFRDDPGIKAQMSGVPNAGELMRAQCLGQVRAFAETGCVMLLDKGPSFMIGYRTDKLPAEKLVDLLQDASREALAIATPEQLEALQANIAPVAEITDEFWYARRFPSETVYVLQVIAVEASLKGTGAFRRLISPAIAACDKDGTRMVLQTHNPANIPLYEHFGFAVEEELASPQLGLRCFNMARQPKQN